MAAEFTTLLPPSDLATGRTADIASSEKVFANMVNKHQLTRAGANWLKVAIDPFHDAALEVEGQPSYDQANTITQVIKMSRTFTSAHPFELHVASFPIDTSTPAISALNPTNYLALARRAGNVVEPSNSATVTGSLGFLTIAMKDRVPGVVNRLYPDSSGPPDGGTTYYAMSPTAPIYNGVDWAPDNNFTQGLHRIVAAGFEVINTTPVLYAGGLTTVYRQATRAQTVYGNIVDAQGVTNPYCDIELSRAPPANADQAMLLPDSRQWKSTLGAYVPLTQAGQDNPYIQPTSKFRLFDGRDSRSVCDVINSPLTAIGSNFTCPSGFVYPYNYYQNNSSTPFHQSGCIMQLPANSEITVNLRVVMERAPTLTEPDLVVLMRPSPAYDELAWRFYSEAARLMPPGVPLDENFTGAWFKQAAANVLKAAKTAAPVVKQIAKAIPIPAVVAAVQAVEAVERSRARAALPQAARTARKRNRGK